MKSVTLIAVAYNEVHEPYVFLSSMLCQINPNWKVIVYSNGHNPALQAIVDRFGDPRIVYKHSETNTGYWGCYNRIKALTEVDTEYVIQTSIQDYFLPNAIEEILSREEDFIYYDCIHHSFGFNILKTVPKVGMIDWGNFAIKTDLARKVGINHPEDYCADGKFVEDCMNSGLIMSIYKLGRVLTIHN